MIREMAFRDPKAIRDRNRRLNLSTTIFLILEWDKDCERYKLTADSGFAHVTKFVLNGSCLDMSCGDPLF